MLKSSVSTLIYLLDGYSPQNKFWNTIEQEDNLDIHWNDRKPQITHKWSDLVREHQDDSRV